MGDVAGEAGVGYRLRHEVIIQLLRLIDLVTAGIASGMEMPNVLDVISNGASDSWWITRRLTGSGSIRREIEVGIFGRQCLGS